MKKLILIFALLLLTGCGAGEAVEGVKSVTDAGVTSYHNSPVIGDADQVKHGEITEVIFGKEYDGFSMELKFDPATQRVMGLKVNATGVGAFRGQEAAADAIVAVQGKLTELGIAGTDAAQGILTEVIKAFIPISAPPE